VCYRYNCLLSIVVSLVSLVHTDSLENLHLGHFKYLWRRLYLQVCVREVSVNLEGMQFLGLNGCRRCSINFRRNQCKRISSPLQFVGLATRFVSVSVPIYGYVNAMLLRINSMGNDVCCQSQASTHAPVETQLSELPQRFCSQRNSATSYQPPLRNIVALQTRVSRRRVER
jgi:hypothetical protein